MSPIAPAIWRTVADDGWINIVFYIECGFFETILFRINIQRVNAILCGVCVLRSIGAECSGAMWNRNDYLIVVRVVYLMCDGLPILSLRCRHWEMCGNWRILRHFLLFPLLLSEPPIMNGNTNWVSMTQKIMCNINQIQLFLLKKGYRQINDQDIYL